MKEIVTRFTYENSHFTKLHKSLLFFKILLYSLKNMVNFVEAIKEIYKTKTAAIQTLKV